MANEAIKVELYGSNYDGTPRRYTVANGTAISKGTLLKLTDPRTAAAADATSTAVNICCAGIAAMDKEASDGSTSISAWTNGIFECVASGAIPVGAAITFITGNYVALAHNGSGAIIAGYSLETAANAELVNVRIAL